MDAPAAIEDRQDIGVDVDDHLQLGASQHDGLCAFLFEHGDDGLQFAFGLAGGFAEQQFVVDDPVQRLDPLHVGWQQLDVARETSFWR